MAGSGSATSAWAPLRIGLFRTLWIAALASNVGTWKQTVGAQWQVWMCVATLSPARSPTGW